MKKFFKATLASAALGLSAHAMAIDLPAPNQMSVGVYGDFYVYSLQLLDSCSSPSALYPTGDPRCKPSGPFPVPSNTATIGNELLIYKSATGNTQSNYKDGAPFASGTQGTAKVDEPFDSETGIGSNFDMSTLNEPNGEDPALTPSPGNYGGAFSPDFAGDKNGTWEASLKSVRDWLNGLDLLFWFGNNQAGDTTDQVQYLFAQVRLTDSTGALVDLDPGAGTINKCWELNSTVGTIGAATTGCMAGSPAFEPDPLLRTPLASGDYVGTGGAFCVDKVTGLAYVPAGSLPGNDGDCEGTGDQSPAGNDGYFVNNNIGQSTTEFAAFIPELNTNLAAWAAAGYFMSIDFSVRNLTDGGDQLWIQGARLPRNDTPEPGSLALLALGLLGAAAVAKRRRH